MDTSAMGMLARKGVVVSFVVTLTGALVVSVTPGSMATPAPVAAGPGVGAVSTAARSADLSTPAPRTVPTYVKGRSAAARTKAGSGSADTLLPLGARGTVLWGDWTGQDAESPAVYRNGTWRIYDTAVGHRDRLEPVVTLRYGTAGDRPVVGDWDGDGRTDIAVVRGRTWFLSRPDYARGITSTWRRFDFGTRVGQPVAGDWTGRGRDGIAQYDRGTWRLKTQARSGSPTRKLRFSGVSGSQAQDVAVAGDWRGTGRDGFGIVRGSTWRYLHNPLSGKERSTVRVQRPDSSWQPAPWTTAAGTAGDRCPTARWSTPLPDPGISAPVGLAGSVPSPTTPGSDGVRTALQRAENYLLNSHYREKWASTRYQDFVDVRASNPNEEVSYRGPAMSALTVAVALATDAHDPAVVGLSRASATSYVQYLVGAVACQHRSVSPGGWGHGSQSAHWAGLAAQAAWLVWDDLSEPVRAYVGAMILSEASDQLTIPVGYWKDRSGTLNPGREGNTAAEESAWNSAFLELAFHMLPASAATRAYRAQAVQLEASAYATPRDLTSDTVVNGVTLRDRLDGTNALDDGTVINHDLVHPDYMGNIQMLWWGADFAVLSGRSVTEAALTQAPLVYGAFSTLSFTAGAPSAAGGSRRYFAPGGTIYRPEDSDPNSMYFPDGSDWGATRRAPFVSVDAHAVALGIAPEGAWPAEQALVAHTDGQLALSARYGDGRSYSPDPEIAKVQDRYGGREEYAASQVAAAYLALVLHEVAPDGPAVDTSTYPAPVIASRQAPVPAPSSRLLGP